MSENLHRRPLEPTQRAACALWARDLCDQRAKERLKTSTGGRNPQPMEDLSQAGSTARDEVGKVFGVSGRLVGHVKRVYERIPRLTFGRRKPLDNEIAFVTMIETRENTANCHTL